jgi:outer membrane protein assembly factor BamB
VNLSAPNVAWRTFLGGAPSHWSTYFPIETPSAPLTTQHAIIARGGRFVALDMMTQQQRWETAVLGPGGVAGIADLDGDGTSEVVVQTQTQAHVLDGATGAVRWSSDTELVETMGMTRVRDMDGDGLHDVYIDNGVGANYGIDAASVYTFVSGQGVKLWDFPLIGPDPFTISSGTDGLLDLNGDGETEVVLPSYSTARILRGSDGSELTTLVALQGVPPGSLQHTSSYAVDLDGEGDLEVVLVQEYGISAQAGPLVAAYRVDVAAGTSEPMWVAQVAAADVQFASTTDLLSDLDGDGVSEVIYSTRVGNDTWRTQVLHGADGSLLHEVVGSRLEGTFDFDGLPGEELVLASDAGLSVFHFDAGAPTPLTQIGSTIPNRRGVNQQSRDLRASTWLDQKLAVLARPGQSPLLLAGELATDFHLKNSNAGFASVDGYALTNGEWVKEHTYAPKLGTITGVIEAGRATRPYEQLAFGASTGLVDVLNQEMEVTNGLTWFGGERLGAFVGGASVRGNPLVATDDDGPFVVLPGTAIGTVVADATYASWIIPPIPRWWDATLTNVSVLDLDGSTRVAGVSQGKALVSLDSKTGAGSSAVEMPLGFPWGTPVALRTGAGTRVAIDWRDFTLQIRQTAVDFSLGQIVFEGDPLPFGGYFGSSVGDLDQNGVDEWYSMSSGTLRQRDAATGQVSTFASLPDIGYSMPIVTTHPQGGAGLFIQGGWGAVGLVDAAGQVSWTSPVVEPVNAMSGAIVECATARRFVTSATLSPTLSSHDLATGAVVATRTFAAGEAFPDVATAAAAGKLPGVMGHVTGVTSLAGAPAAVVGSSDGHVYVVDPCTLDLRWALDLGASVGDPIVADSDGDGEDEILIAAADGFLYGLDDFSFPAPFIELSGQPAEGPLVVTPGTPIDVSWPEVDGAAGYEVALIGPDGKPVWSPAYTPVDVPSIQLVLDGALANRPYRVVARVAGDEPGKEGFSARVLVSDTTPPSAELAATGGTKAVLAVTASDDLALDHTLLSAADAIMAEALLDGATSSSTLEWTPTAADLGTDVTLTVTVVDSAGLRAEKTLVATVDESGNVSFPTQPEQPGTGGAGGGPGAGGADGSDPPDGADDVDVMLDASCTCETRAPREGAHWLGGLAAMGLVAWRRRRRVG